MKNLILHAHSTGPNPYKVAMVMENLKIPYDLKLWDFGDGENGVKGPNFLKINENGRVPALGKHFLQNHPPAASKKYFTHIHQHGTPTSRSNPSTEPSSLV